MTQNLQERNLRINTNFHPENPIDNPVKNVLSMWDAMLIAKHDPGKYDVPFVAGMNITSASTGVINTPFDAVQAYKLPTPAMANLGSYAY